MAFYIAPPQSMSGDDKDSIRKTYSYLYQLSEQLNYTLNNLTGENMTVQVAEAIQKADNQLNEKSTVQQQADTLKSFIVKTARTIELTMEQMEEAFAMDYLAKSEFGEYLQKNEMTIKTTAQGVVQSFTGYDSAESFQKEQAGFESYITETEQYIKSGYLYDETSESGISIPRYGVAVGENLTKVMVDGKEQLSRGGYVVTHTSDEVAFWVNNVKVLYISNGRAFLPEVEVTGKMIHGEYVEYIAKDGSLVLGMR